MKYLSIILLLLAGTARSQKGWEASVWTGPVFVKDHEVRPSNSLTNANHNWGTNIFVGRKFGRVGVYGNYFRSDIENSVWHISENDLGFNHKRNYLLDYRAFGVKALYHHPGIFKIKEIQPFVGLGVQLGAHTIHYDDKDGDGNFYNYWSDGTIRDQWQSMENYLTATKITRDYIYETPYPSKTSPGPLKIGTIMFPITVGARIPISHRLSTNISYTNYLFGGLYYATHAQTKSIASLNVGLTFTLSKKEQQEDGMTPEILALDSADADGDGVIDLRDDCQGTSDTLKVDKKGCPLDDDNDGIPNYRDKEPKTKKGATVDTEGKTIVGAPKAVENDESERPKQKRKVSDFGEIQEEKN